MTTAENYPEPQYHRKSAYLEPAPEEVDPKQLIDEARVARIEDLEEQLEAANLRAEEAAELAEDRLDEIRATRARLLEAEEMLTTPAKAVSQEQMSHPVYSRVYDYLELYARGHTELVRILEDVGPIERAGWFATLDSVKQTIAEDLETLVRLQVRAGVAERLLEEGE